MQYEPSEVGIGHAHLENARSRRQDGNFLHGDLGSYAELNGNLPQRHAKGRLERDAFLSIEIRDAQDARRLAAKPNRDIVERGQRLLIWAARRDPSAGSELVAVLRGDAFEANRHSSPNRRGCRAAKLAGKVAAEEDHQRAGAYPLADILAP